MTFFNFLHYSSFETLSSSFTAIKFNQNHITTANYSKLSPLLECHLFCNENVVFYKRGGGTTVLLSLNKIVTIEKIIVINKTNIELLSNILHMPLILKSNSELKTFSMLKSFFFYSNFLSKSCNDNVKPHLTQNSRVVKIII